MKKLFLLSVLLLMTGLLPAQFYIPGEPPASVKWQQIKAGPFKIIFPEGTKPDAEKFASLLIFYKDSSKIVPGKDISIPVIMRTSSVISNGYVSWAPKRMDIVTTSPRNTYPQDWLNQLALHEYRHVAQISALRTGFTKFLSVFSGEIATGITSAMVPRWFYEGDAVFNETKLSSSGRGRLPEFSMPLRTLLLSENKVFSYDKAFFGSYKDFVPDHYMYGYQLVNYGVERYGDNLWENALTYIGRNPYQVTPMAFYLVKATGHARQHLYKSAMDSLRNIFLSDTLINKYTDYKVISDTDKSDYINYNQPVYTEDGDILSFKTGLDGNDRIISIDSTGKETIIHYPGTSEMNSLSSEGNFIAWDEIVRDVRWGGRSFSEIMVFDRRNNNVFPLIRKTRLFSPDISPDGTRIAVIETDNRNNCSLVVIDIENREIIQKFPSPDNLNLLTPEWTHDGKILVIAVWNSIKQLIEFSPASENWQILFESETDIAEPEGYGDFVIFRAAFGNVDNLYSINKKSGRLWKITSSRFGAFNPEISRDSASLVFAEYSSEGFNIVRTQPDSSSWQTVNMHNKEHVWNVEKEERAKEPLLFNRTYEPLPYSRMNLLNFHSWLPFFTDINERNPSGMNILPGFMLFSQNITGTAVAGLNYFSEKGTHYIRPEISFTGLFPIIRIAGDFVIHSPTPAEEDDTRDNVTGNNLTAEAYVPLLFTKGRKVMQVMPGVTYSRLNMVFDEDGILKTGIDLFKAEINFSAYRKRSYREIIPRAGFSGNFTHYFTPLNKSSFGSLTSYSGILFLPGMMKYHSFYIRHGIQKHQAENYLLPVTVGNRPRGFTYYAAEFHAGASFNYTLPLWYPDWSVPSVIYIKRLWLNSFADIAYGKNLREKGENPGAVYSGSYYSYGLEFYADINPLRFIFPVSAGVRLGYVPRKDKLFTEFLLTVSTDI